MATVEKVIEAANALRAKGERVSYRSVNAWFRDGGGWGCSNSDIRDTLRAWVRDENYDVVLETSGLPKAVSAAMAKAGAVVWAEAQKELAAKLVKERERLGRSAEAERAFLDEALATLDQRAAEIAKLNDEIDELKAKVTAAEDDLQTVRAREFWERVVREIHEVFPRDRSLHIMEIATLAGPDLVEEAERHKETWDPETIRGKLDQKAMRRRFFTNKGNGFYSRRSEGEAA